MVKVSSGAVAGLGFQVSGEATGGSADSGFTAALGTARARSAATPTATTVSRAQALALTILEAAAG
jgi:hypothetical protein